MSAILLMRGPVCTQRALHDGYCPAAIKHIVKQQFVNAANTLVRLNMGSLVHLSKRDKGKWPCDVFIKRQPSEMLDVLQGNKDLCSMGDYNNKFCLSSPVCISAALKDQLISRGLVKKELFDGK